MKRISSRHLPGLLAEIQLTPMLDLMLVLLLAVVVLVPALQSDGGKVNQGGKEPTKTIDLVVAPDLKLTLAGEAITDQALIANLQKRVSAAPDLGVVVRAPATLTTPALLQIMDALAAAAVRHTAVVNDTAKTH